MMAALTGFAPAARLEIDVAGLRSAKGWVRVCLSHDPRHFPDCSGDPTARRLTVPAAEAARIIVPDLPSGSYAVALIHDENGNARLDKVFGIPKEGVGFSQNPKLSFGPPSFAAASFALDGQPVTHVVKMKYFL